MVEPKPDPEVGPELEPLLNESMYALCGSSWCPRGGGGGAHPLGGMPAAAWLPYTSAGAADPSGRCFPLCVCSELDAPCCWCRILATFCPSRVTAHLPSPPPLPFPSVDDEEDEDVDEALGGRPE